MELTTCARPYAKAAFQHALGQNALDSWLEMLKSGAAVVRNDKVNVLLGMPSLTAEQKANAFIDVCGDSLSDSGRNFVRTLADNKRLTLLPQIAELFEALKAEQEQSVDVEVLSAFPLSSEQLEKLGGKLRSRLSSEVRLVNTLDPELIGGVVIRAGDLVIDSSIKTRLEKLADAMLS
ncbi:F0F1 ATP synthase subunit delta [Sansalvadorimonas sp. 2012CJ34-2]|uniref:ATP synthase subunit delta n=1 Tax=Parendozoicomonas callyspongiae TaxID=2942213 RepID=A0ABT0PB52_9GAMM|nr:F0F1 ATP synthase subunit delta [Sansalvadorimonas sp. 2012CJ34-2]MCL6268574.1 F0F1 ATP synthase subunit delta [Sansalvadorimonas sp. 2012CJ34-2]